MTRPTWSSGTTVFDPPDSYFDSIRTGTCLAPSLYGTEPALVEESQRAEIHRKTVDALGSRRSPAFLSGPATSLAPTLNGRDLATALKALAEEAPAVFPAWMHTLEANAEYCSSLPVDSVSVRGHPIAEHFRLFLRPYSGGTILDIGCGPQYLPSYLESVSPQRIAGIDPVPPVTTHPFEYARGVAEFLPWSDNLFDLVIIATSLDHVLLVDRALSEVHRVLKPTGIVAVWVGFVPGAARYDPYAGAIASPDRFHLFHFDKPGFESAFESCFSVREVIWLPLTYTQYFYAFNPRRID